jgi:mRNA degradation ribonuclease J1/J2
VVYESARVEQNESLMSRTVDENSQKIIREMVNGIIGEIKASEISRINVVFNIENK